MLDVVLMPRGEAIVVFNTVMDCQMALGRDRYVAPEGAGHRREGRGASIDLKAPADRFERRVGWNRGRANSPVRPLVPSVGRLLATLSPNSKIPTDP